MSVIYCFGDNHNFTFNNGHSLICVRLNIRLKTDQYLSKWFKVPAFGAFVNSHSLSSTEWRRIDKSFIFFKMFSPIPLKLGLYEEKMMFLLFFHWNTIQYELIIKKYYTYYLVLVAASLCHYMDRSKDLKKIKMENVDSYLFCIRKSLGVSHTIFPYYHQGIYCSMQKSLEPL